MTAQVTDWFSDVLLPEPDLFGALAIHCSASSLLALSNASRALSACVAAEFKHWLRKAPAVQPGVTRMLAFAAGMGPAAPATSDAEWRAFRVLYDRHVADNQLNNAQKTAAAQISGSWAPREGDPTPRAPRLTAPLWPSVRAQLALHAWAVLYFILRT